MTQFFDLSQARRLGYEQKRINIDFPIWMIEALEHEAKHLGVTSFPSSAPSTVTIGFY
jgi:hypothetical protein